MWEDLLNFGEEHWESLSEGAGTVFDGYVSLEKAKQQEALKDPEVLKAAEPTKGTRTDGSTIVRQTLVQKPFITGVDNTVVIVAGSLLAVALLFVLKGAK
jgi:hypothetical protein